MSPVGIGTAAALGLLGALAAAPPAAAQQQTRVAKDDAALVVDGVVRQVYRSPRQGRTDYLVQIEVRRSEGRRPLTGPARPSFPAPGEVVYVHVAPPQAAPGDGATAVPDEGAQVRAYLTPREQGGWEGTSPEWFDGPADRPVTVNRPAPAPGTTEASPGRATLPGLGLTAEPRTVQGRLVLRVTSVERGGPAQRAGLEAGDVIIGAKGEPLTGADQLDELARRGGAFPLIVLDVHTGRTAQVEVRPTAAAAPPEEPRPGGEAPPAPAPAGRRSLGVSAETVTVGQRTAMKVTRVSPDSPAAKAGLEPGDVIVAANGAAITGPEQLAAALRKSGPTLTLTVRDTRTGRETPVSVELGGPQPAAPPPAEAAPAGGGSGNLGVVTELSFYDTEAAVKVTEVAPGSPAARAGLVPGTIILAANGKVMLHPTELTNAARDSGGTLKLTVVDPRTGRKGNVDVPLGPGG
jgi:S1-C subfamily serine protease